MALFIAPDVAIDLGTSNTLVYVKGAGIEVNEPSVLLVDTSGKHTVKAIGDDAHALMGRTGDNSTVVNPLKDGVISDYEMTVNMIRSFLRRAIGSSYLVGPRISLTVSCNISSIERKAVNEAAQAAGARRNHVYLIEKPFVAALGSGLPVYEAVGSMIVDIGGGTVDIAVISLGGIVIHQSIRVGGNKMDEAIANYTKREFNIEIGLKTAEDIKLDLGAAVLLPEERVIRIRGRDVITSLPHDTKLTSRQVHEALHEPCLAILEAIKKVLEKTPPELSADIMRNGIYLSGGGAKLAGLDQFIADEIGIPVFLAKDPAEASILGQRYLIDNIEVMLLNNKQGLLTGI